MHEMPNGVSLRSMRSLWLIFSGLRSRIRFNRKDRKERKEGKTGGIVLIGGPWLTVSQLECMRCLIVCLCDPCALCGEVFSGLRSRIRFNRKDCKEHGAAESQYKQLYL